MVSKKILGNFVLSVPPQNHIVCPDLCLWATATGKQKLILQIKTDLLGFALHLWEGFVWVWVFPLGGVWLFKLSSGIFTTLGIC